MPVHRHAITAPERASRYTPRMIVAVANQKGGVGKTTSVVCLCAALVEAGQSVLAVDLDPQAALTGWLIGEPRETVYPALHRPEATGEAISRLGGLSVLPASLDLAGIEVELASATDRHQRLARALSPLRHDWTIIDTPPSLGVLTLNALYASDYVLVPVACEWLALKGLAILLESVLRVQDSLNPRLRVLGILPTMYDRRTLHSREVLEALRSQFREHVFAPIRSSVRFREAPIARKSILEYDPGSDGASAYRDLAKEVMKRA